VLVGLSEIEENYFHFMLVYIKLNILYLYQQQRKTTQKNTQNEKL
jgi:hypothetical protein